MCGNDWHMGGVGVRAGRRVGGVGGRAGTRASGLAFHVRCMVQAYSPQPFARFSAPVGGAMQHAHRPTGPGEPSEGLGPCGWIEYGWPMKRHAGSCPGGRTSPTPRHGMPRTSPTPRHGMPRTSPTPRHGIPRTSPTPRNGMARTSPTPRNGICHMPPTIRHGMPRSSHSPRYGIITASFP